MIDDNQDEITLSSYRLCQYAQFHSHSPSSYVDPDVRNIIFFTTSILICVIFRRTSNIYIYIYPGCRYTKYILPLSSQFLVFNQCPHYSSKQTVILDQGVSATSVQLPSPATKKVFEFFDFFGGI